MFIKLTAPLAAAMLMATPLLAQQAETPQPVVVQPQAPAATPSNLQTNPTAVTPAAKSNCMRGAKHVMS